MIIYKQFKNKNYQGKIVQIVQIVQHDAHEKLYEILYEDEDVEELSHEEVIKYANASIETLLTRFQRITELRNYKCPLQGVSQMQPNTSNQHGTTAMHNDWIPQ